MSELLPCPFCGGQPEMRESSTHDFYIKCKGCGVATRKNHENSVGAVMDWNTRAEQTCKFEFSLARNGWADHTCTNCGYTRNTDIQVYLDYNYCPNCGARVVE